MPFTVTESKSKHIHSFIHSLIASSSSSFLSVSSFPSPFCIHSVTRPHFEKLLANANDGGWGGDGKALGHNLCDSFGWPSSNVLDCLACLLLNSSQPIEKRCIPFRKWGTSFVVGGFCTVSHPLRTARHAEEIALISRSPGADGFINDHFPSPFSLTSSKMMRNE
uniref:Uncharacterized protein n=1 Tax=Globodera rostochiensis TaxID=31243 RepID=A0A914HFV0_GLORO